MRDIHCECGYIREEELIKQIAGIIDKVDINEIGMKCKFEMEIERYDKFRKNVLGVKEDDIEREKEINIRNYVKYLLREGSITEKRELLAFLKSRLVVRDKMVAPER